MMAVGDRRAAAGTSRQSWLVAHGVDRFRAMLRIRQFEEAVTELRVSQQVVGSVHLCIGQEAAPAVLQHVRSGQDRVLATYRGHGWAIGCGVPLVALFGELLGRECGTNEGRGGSAMLSAAPYGFLGENSIVGAGAPIACGVALASRFRSADRVVFCAFGDGAMNQGAVHEAFNFAGAMRLPIVFICENNYWSELTATEEMVFDPQLHRRGDTYGLASERVDGNDLFELEGAFIRATQRAREEGGPSLLEVMTQRLVGHYIGDYEQYRRPGELEQARKVEALARLERELLEAGVGAADLDDVRKEVEHEVAAAREAALASPLADQSRVMEHLYA